MLWHNATSTYCQRDQYTSNVISLQRLHMKYGIIELPASKYGIFSLHYSRYGIVPFPHSKYGIVSQSQSKYSISNMVSSSQSNIELYNDTNPRYGLRHLNPHWIANISDTFISLPIYNARVVCFFMEDCYGHQRVWMWLAGTVISLLLKWPWLCLYLYLRIRELWQTPWIPPTMIMMHDVRFGL